MSNGKMPNGRDFAPIWTLIGAELRMLLRDRRTIVASVILPIVVLPLFFFASSFTERQRDERIEAQEFSYALSGSQSDMARRLLASENPADTQSREADDQAVQVKLSEKTVADARAALDARDIEAIVVSYSHEEYSAHTEALAAEALAADALASGSEPPEPAARNRTEELETGGEAEVLPPLPVFEIVYYANRDYSQTAARALETRFHRARADNRRQLLKDAGFPVHPLDVTPIAEEVDVASARERTGAGLGRFATAFLMMFLLVGGSVVAADTLAGEKERGTLETLLTSAASRWQIVVAKLLVIFIVGAFITVVQLINLGVYVGLDVLDLPADFKLPLTPLSLGWLLLLFLPLALLVAGILLWVSGRSSSYKAFQINFFPVMLLSLPLALAAMLPAVSLRSVIAVVPIANISVAVREVLSGRFDIAMLCVVWLVSMTVALVVARATIRSLGTERLVTAAEVDRAAFLGGPELFARRVLLIFAVMWVVIFLVASNITAMAGLRPQVLFNIVLVFFGGSMMMLWRYQLPAREALALRAPRPLVWAAVMLGGPATFLVGVALSLFSSRLFPMPQEMLEAFSRGLLPEGVSVWQLLLFIAVLPAICEEIAFRGVLLYGLRERFGPVVLSLVVAATFALFHFQANRLLPTFFLGVVMCVLTLLTGSIYPAMLWHFLNNASAILVTRMGLDVTSLEPWIYAAAGVVSALSFALIYRQRTPYPGIRIRQTAIKAR